MVIPKDIEGFWALLVQVLVQEFLLANNIGFWLIF